MPALPNTQVIRKVLSAATRLWLRSQVEAVGTLQFQIEGSDRQLLSGKIPKIFILGDALVYKGLQLTHLEVIATDIQINLGQVLRGRALKLLQPLVVEAQLRLHQDDLNACLQTSLLTPVLGQLLDQWLKPLQDQPLQDQQSESGNHEWQNIQVTFEPDRLNLAATLVAAEQTAAEQTAENYTNLQVGMGAGLKLADPRTLLLTALQWSASDPKAQTALETVDQLTLDLGSDVEMASLVAQAGQIACQGQLVIRP